MIRVLLAVDDHRIRAGLRIRLASARGVAVVGEAVGGADTLALTQQLHPDVVVIERRGLGAAAATRSIAGHPTLTRVRVVVAHPDTASTDLLVAALRAGASGFVTVDGDDPVPVIRDVVDGKTLPNATATRELLQAYARPNRPPDARTAALSDRDREVIRQVAAGLTNTQMAAALELNPTTMFAYVNHLMARLGLRCRMQLVVYGYAAGLIGADAGAYAGA